MEIDAMPEVLTAKNITEHLQLTKATIYTLMSKKDGIPSFRVGNSPRVFKKDYIKWLNERVSK